jgi:pSer/pThr/pTyr-binding forkhead associated (FHA) protein
MRPSEETRERTVARLRRGYVAGRLDTDTFSRRIDSALAAQRHDELHGLTADLPAPRRRWRDLIPQGRALPPAISGRVLLGRSSGCELVFADDTVSRRHAELRVEDGRWMLRDLGSSNGTYVNGRRVMEAEVAAGDEIVLGGCRFRL